MNKLRIGFLGELQKLGVADGRLDRGDPARAAVRGLQRVDLGIAMCHFELTARELGFAGRWAVQDPDIAKPDDRTEYIVSWIG